MYYAAQALNFILLLSWTVLLKRISISITTKKPASGLNLPIVLFKAPGSKRSGEHTNGIPCQSTVNWMMYSRRAPDANPSASGYSINRTRLELVQNTSMKHREGKYWVFSPPGFLYSFFPAEPHCLLNVKIAGVHLLCLPASPTFQRKKHYTDKWSQQG